jgi:hypothetical protein
LVGVGESWLMKANDGKKEGSCLVDIRRVAWTFSILANVSSLNKN